jgi:uncharacterized protein (DUF1330 family)
MSAYVIFDVEIRDPARYRAFMQAIRDEVSLARLVSVEGLEP